MYKGSETPIVKQQNPITMARKTTYLESSKTEDLNLDNTESLLVTESGLLRKNSAMVKNFIDTVSDQLNENDKMKKAIQHFMEVQTIIQPSDKITINDILKDFEIDEKNLPNHDALLKMKNNMIFSTIFTHKLGKRVLWKQDKIPNRIKNMIISPK